jgi:ribosomal protein S18 acetylase RimI-like enzyme
VDGVPLVERELIRSLRASELPQCEHILRSLPQWFGIEEALVGYVEELPTLECFVEEREDALTGFLSLRHHNPFTSEIHVIAVRAECHGRGIGRALIEHAESVLRARSIEYLQVKTLGPSRPDEHYDRTRRFYERLGFRPLEENLLWGPKNPCLILVKHLTCQSGPAVERLP